MANMNSASAYIFQCKSGQIFSICLMNYFSFQSFNIELRSMFSGRKQKKPVTDFYRKM